MLFGKCTVLIHANIMNIQKSIYFHDLKIQKNIFILLILYNKAKRVVRRSKNLEVASYHPRPLEKKECSASILANIWLLGGAPLPPAPQSARSDGPVKD